MTNRSWCAANVRQRRLSKGAIRPRDWGNFVSGLTMPDSSREVRVFDSSNQSAAMRTYLESRLRAQLPPRFRCTVKFAARLASSADVAALGDHMYLAAIMGKGGEGEAMRLFQAFGKPANDGIRRALQLDLTRCFSGMAGTAGVTYGRISIVPTTRLSPFPDADSVKANRIFLSNLLIHEVGHALSDKGANADHRTGGVMKPELSTDDPELGYSAAFVHGLK